MSKTHEQLVNEFLAKGGEVKKIPEGQSAFKRKSSRKPKSKKIDAQALLDAAVGTDKEAEVVAFLQSQGIEVE